MNHYSEFRGTKTWSTISQAIDALERNRDLVLQTKKDYVIGYLTSKLRRSTSSKSVSVRTTVRKKRKEVSRTRKNA